MDCRQPFRYRPNGQRRVRFESPVIRPEPRNLESLVSALFGEGVGDLSLIKDKSSGWLIDTGNQHGFSSYSVRKACIGSILVARLAGSHAAAMVITETAAIAMEIAVGSSGLNS